MAAFEDSRHTALSEFKHQSMAPDCMNTHMAWQACNIYVHTHLQEHQINSIEEKTPITRFAVSLC